MKAKHGGQILGYRYQIVRLDLKYHNQIGNDLAWDYACHLSTYGEDFCYGAHYAYYFAIEKYGEPYNTGLIHSIVFRDLFSQPDLDELCPTGLEIVEWLKKNEFSTDTEKWTIDQQLLFKLTWF